MSSKYQCKNVASGDVSANLSKMNLLKWINDLLDVKIETVESLCSGAAYCQILDKLFPGCIPLMKVKLEATQSQEFWMNYKYLESGFHAIGCDKEIPIDDLLKAQFSDNFEFLQWFKKFYDVNYDEATMIASEHETGPRTSSKGPKSRGVLTLQQDKYSQAEIEREMPGDGLPPEGLPPVLPPAEPEE